MEAWILITIVTLASGEERTHLQDGGSRAHCEHLAAELNRGSLIRAYCDRARPPDDHSGWSFECANCGTNPTRPPA